MARHEIAHLRSPSVHHPGPNPHGLSDRARTLDGPDSVLVGRYGLPGTGTFASYCRLLVRQAELEGAVRTGTVTSIEVDEHGPVVHLDHGSIHAERVVVAINGATQVLPPWARTDDACVRHSDAVDLREERDLEGRHVAVVGGGLTAVQLVVGAARRGAHPTLIARRRLQVQPFDADPGWLGPKLLAGFWKEPDPAVRRARLFEVRKGSVPDGDAGQLDDLVRRGRAELLTERVVKACTTDPEGRRSLLLDDGAELVVHEMWCATGHRHDVLARPELAALSSQHPTRVCEGLPVLEDDLSWGGLPVHLMGAYAGLVLGPTARNLSGARRAAERITEAHRPGHLLRRRAAHGWFGRPKLVGEAVHEHRHRLADAGA